MHNRTRGNASVLVEHATHLRASELHATKQRWVALSFCIACLAALTVVGCQSFALKNVYPDVSSVDSAGPKYLHNVSLIQSWDRLASANTATGFAWWDSTGKVQETGNYWNKVIVLNFFGTWSPPAISQIKTMLATIPKLDSNVFFIGAAQREPHTGGKEVIALDSFAKANNIHYQLLVGSRDFGFTYGGIDVVPTTFIIDRRRKITATFEGEVSSDVLLQAIKKAEFPAQ